MDFTPQKNLDYIIILEFTQNQGHPRASSTHHNFPLLKKGYISSNPADFTEDGEGYLDLCSECGMSGAPIILNDSQLKLVGILVQNIKSERSLTPSTAIYVSADKILNMK